MIPGLTISEIENFILDAGSDDLPIFGGDVNGGIYAMQIHDEIGPCICAIMESNEPIRNYLEIGVAAGGTTFLFNHFFVLETIVLIDDNRHDKRFLRPKVLKGINYKEIIGRSQDAISVKALVDINKTFDIIMIDGDHSYLGAKTDTVLYIPFLRPGGFSILHDSVNPSFEVSQVVKDLKIDSSMKFIGEYVSVVHPNPCGVALFQKVYR